jgi:succinate dehydrogenase / fumarate reductase, cytochrome b subunit
VSQLKRYLSSHIGRKVVMGLTGLLLIGFLITHMAANLLILAGDQGSAFNNYSHALTSNPLIYVAEVGLLALFIGHMINGIVITLKNKAARSQAYAFPATAGRTSRKSAASRTMIITGILVLIFVPLHVWMFKYGVKAQRDGIDDLYSLVLGKFSNIAMVIWYMLSMVVVGFHLWHGFGSGFESLGVRYRKPLRRAGQALAVLIAGGFFLIPPIVFLSQH